MSSTPRGFYELTDQDLGSMEMVFIAFTILESRGYPGFVELLSILNDPKVLLKIIRFMYGMEIKIPPLHEFVKCLRASEYIFTDMHKKANSSLSIKPQDIREHMHITKEQEAELLQIFDDWVAYMHKQGKNVQEFMHINRNNTKKRIAMVQNGKKWKAKLW